MKQKKRTTSSKSNKILTGKNIIKTQSWFSLKRVMIIILSVSIVGGYFTWKTFALTLTTPLSVKIAQNEIGQREWSSRVLQYSQNNQENWCADFVSWVYMKSGKPLTGSTTKWRVPLVYQRYTGVPNLRDIFMYFRLYKTKETGYIPNPGNVVIFARNGRSHTGIVEKVVKTGYGPIIYTIEGNTSTHDVARRQYSIYDSTIDGYGTIQ